MPVTDPVTGVVTSTVVVRPDGTYTFTPAPGFVGPVPPITYTVTASDGQAKDSVLDITVRPQLLDDNEELTTPANTPVTTNVLANVVPPPGTPVGTLVANGQASLGFQQLSELIALPGIDVLGTLPEDMAFITTFSSSIASVVAEDATRVAAAQSFMQFLASAGVEDVKRKKGMHWL